MSKPADEERFQAIMGRLVPDEAEFVISRLYQQGKAVGLSEGRKEILTLVQAEAQVAFLHNLDEKAKALRELASLIAKRLRDA